MSAPLRITILGLSITSSWGNGHATTYRGLVGALCRRGHDVTFLERDMPWYAENRDLPEPPFGRLGLYSGLQELKARFTGPVASADLVIVGSYVPDGAAVAEWVLATAVGLRAFYDIDTPVTLAALERDACAYLTRGLIPRFDLYLSFTGGPLLRRLEREWGAQRARALFCSADPLLYYPEHGDRMFDLGYIGTYGPDRQPALERLLLEPARLWPPGRFIVAGPMYPPEIPWPDNVRRVDHLPPRDHRRFYNAQRFTLNITRADMVRMGWSPSVRLFEAAACGTPIISDVWAGLEDFFEPGTEILAARSTAEALGLIRDMPEKDRRRLGRRGRLRVLAAHTADHRAAELEACVREAVGPPLGRKADPARTDPFSDPGRDPHRREIAATQRGG